MSPKNLISLNDWSIGDIKNILNLALNNLSFKSDLSGKLLINLFFENSTRTRVSFEIAAKRLGMHVINVNSSTSSVKKGETLLDTLETLQALSPDIIVFRHNGSGAADFIAQNINCPVINAGDGSHAHPTQALLDAFTIQQAKGRIAGLIVAICGDILHSRVARSNIICLSKLGAKIRLIAPSTLLPYNIENMGLEIYHDMKSGLKDVDVIMMLRMQKERMELAFVPSIREYHHFYGLTNEALNYAKNDCIIMHPGPINRDAEIASQVTKDKKCHILQQVSHGVAVRMAVIETLLQDDEND